MNLSNVMDEMEKRKLRQTRAAELHQQIVSGAIDIGPITSHADVIHDTRDKRDPTEVGLEVLASRAAPRNGHH